MEPEDNEVEDQLLLKRFPEMDYYLNESLSDITFVIDGQRLPANKAILAFKSEVFRAQFFGEFADSGLKEIAISDATVEGFKAMLLFLHKEELTLTTDACIDLAKDVYNLSHKYQLKRLMEAMENHFEEHLIDKDNFADIYVFALHYTDNILSKMVMNFMSTNIDKWLDREWDQLIALNESTDNSLFKIIVQKFKQTKDTFTEVVQYHDTFDVFVRGSSHSWTKRKPLHRVIKFNFNKI